MSSIEIAGAVTRANGQSVTWSGGIPNSFVYITGESFFYGATANSEYLTTFTCVQPVSAGQFTIPAVVLESLPASGNSDGISLGGSLGVENGLLQEFTAPNLDLGLIFFGTSNELQVPYN